LKKVGERKRRKRTIVPGFVMPKNKEEIRMFHDGEKKNTKKKTRVLSCDKRKRVSLLRADLGKR